MNAFQMLGVRSTVVSELTYAARISDINRRNSNSGLSPTAPRRYHTYSKAVPTPEDMRKSNHEAVRKLLRAAPDGLSVRQIADELGLRADSVHGALGAMPDAYIDRWKTDRGPSTAVWCVVVPPENCPRPERK